MQKVGILGGTFNPIHYGHLIIAESVRENFCLDKVLFIPSGRPPHKHGREVIAAEHRFEMVRLAVESNPYFEASGVEIGKEGYTYTINTMKLLREQYGKDTNLYFIIGADNIPELETWKDFKDIFKLCEFIAVLRPGHARNSFEKEISYLRMNYKFRVHLIEAPLIDISSSDIRNRLSTGKSIKYLVPEKVEEYIRTKGLYI